MRADGIRNSHIVINHEQHAVFVRDVKIKSLMAVPKNAFEFVDVQRRMTPVVGKQSELGASHLLDYGGNQCEFFFEANRATENHKSLTMSSIDS